MLLQGDGDRKGPGRPLGKKLNVKIPDGEEDSALSETIVQDIFDHTPSLTTQQESTEPPPTSTSLKVQVQEEAPEAAPLKRPRGRPPLSSRNKSIAKAGGCRVHVSLLDSNLLIF